MAPITVGIRELKAQLSRYIQHVRAGETVIITDRGKPIGRIVPSELSPVERLRDLEQSGLVAWSGRKLEPVASAAQVRGPNTVADMLLEDRE